MKRTIISVLLFILLFNVQSAFAQTGASRAPAARNVAERAWPRGYSLPTEAQLVMYEPQIASWDNQKHLVAFAAVSHVAKGEQKPALGTIKFETDTEVSLEQRLVKFSKIKIVETNFQTLSKEQTQEIVSELEKNIPDEDRVITLDRVLAYANKTTINQKTAAGQKSNPPQKINTKTPAILVSFDGEPIWSPI